MPATADVLESLNDIANGWPYVAMGWHLMFGMLLAALVFGWRPSKRALGWKLTVPLLSVSLLAWSANNPFNLVMFLMLAVAVGVISRALSPERIRIAS